MRQFSGRVLLRLPAELHRDLAEEAFRTGRSLNQLCLEALLGRKALKRYNPWNAVEHVWRKNRKIPVDTVDKDVEAAVREVRRAKRR
jgi:HicB family